MGVVNFMEEEITDMFLKRLKKLIEGILVKRSYKTSFHWCDVMSKLLVV